MSEQRLTAGQNAELNSAALVFTVQPAQAEVAALALDDQRRALDLPGAGYVDARGPSHCPGISANPGRLSVRLDALPAPAARVLCLALTPQPHSEALTCTLTDDDRHTTVFVVPAVDVHPAVICIELYRRGPRWKMRAVGQGYASGLAEMARAHGIPEPNRPPAAPVPAADALPNAAQIIPLGDQDPLERITMIYEDAARSTAALNTAYGFAENRRDTEMTAAIADPSTRNSTASQQAQAEAQRRYDEVIATATADYQRDAAHLIAELAALDHELPAALAPFTATTWQQRPQPCHGIRLGTLSVPAAGPLSIPLCLPLPLRRPLWIDTQNAAAATPVASALLARLLAAAPQTSVDVIDLAATLAPLTKQLSPCMPRPAVTSRTDVTERLHALVCESDLTALQKDSAPPAGVTGITVITDPGYGFPPEACSAIVQLLNSGTGHALVLIGDHRDSASSPQPLLREIADYSHRIPLDADDAAVADPWTGTPWRFVPDTMATGRRLADIITLASGRDPAGEPSPW